MPHGPAAFVDSGLTSQGGSLHVEILFPLSEQPFQRRQITPEIGWDKPRIPRTIHEISPARRKQQALIWMAFRRHHLKRNLVP